MKIALVHDYLREYGGAERVVEALHDIWPEAPLYTSFVDWPSFAKKAPAGKVKLFKSWDIRTSWAQKSWLVKKFHSPLRFLAPRIWESFDLSDYDVVLTSSGWFICRGVKAGRRLFGHRATSNEQREEKKKDPLSTLDSRYSKIPMQICYIHHPPRNLYGYATGRTIQKYALVRAYAAFINFFMRQYDYITAQKVDYFIANSQETARRVKKFYRRESVVIYPPVEVSESREQRAVNSKQITGVGKKKEYYLSVGRLVWAKQIELIIEAANKRKFTLKIVGTGPEEARLRALAGSTVEFLGSVSDGRLHELYRGAQATIFCALDEDFGIVPVESMAQGTPVIGLNEGGVPETVIDGKTGILFSSSTLASLDAGIERFEKYPRQWAQSCLVQASRFRTERFRQEITSFVNARMRDRSYEV